MKIKSQQKMARKQRLFSLILFAYIKKIEIFQVRSFAEEQT